MSTAHAATLPSASLLKQQWDTYRQQNKRAFIYDAAIEFGVSEAQLLATGCGDNVTRLDGDWAKFLGELEACGETMALTRNHWAVIEKKGHYKNVSIHGMMGVVLDEGVDLRVFMRSWKHGFAVRTPESKGYRQSFQFFDAAGSAVHKVYVGEHAIDVYNDLVQKYISADQLPEQNVEPAAPAPVAKADREIDRDGLYQTWSNLQDTHDFFGMLKKFEVQRTQAFRLVGPEFAERLDVKAYIPMLEEAAGMKLEIMVFIGNSGCIEIHTGPINKLVPMDNWFNIMDPGFNMHLRTEGVVECWLVRKPTKDGVVTSVEIYDEHGKEIAMFFGKRKPGMPELIAWRALAETCQRY